MKKLNPEKAKLPMRIKKAIDSKIISIKQTLGKLPRQVKQLNNDAIQQMAWYSVMIDELQKKILAAGEVTEEYNHGGGQGGVKVSAEVQVLNSFQKNYSTLHATMLKYCSKVNVPVPETDKEEAVFLKAAMTEDGD